MTADWDAEIGSFLERLSKAQRELLSMLAEKRTALEARDHESLSLLVEREQSLAAELQACQQERSELLERAKTNGLPAGNIAQLSSALGDDAAISRQTAILESRERANLARHDCLTQWVAMQRTLLHLSQMLEIIATGGRPKPTYGDSRGPQPSGALMDQAV